jgi:hypothetical protein
MRLTRRVEGRRSAPFAAAGAVAGVIAAVSVLSGAHPGLADGGGDGTGGASGGSILAGVYFGQPGGGGAGGSGGSGVRCTWEPVEVHDASLPGSEGVTKEVDGVTYVLYERDCAGAVTDVWVAQVDAPRLGVEAADWLVRQLPGPDGRFGPPADAAVVNFSTWFWADGASWRSHSVTAWVPTPDGILWATTTATPVGLVLRPGDGGADVSCAGAGTPRRYPAHPDDAGGCAYTYLHASAANGAARFPARMGIRWEIWWTASTGQGGALTPATTWSDYAINVREVQALVAS